MIRAKLFEFGGATMVVDICSLVFVKAKRRGEGEDVFVMCLLTVGEGVWKSKGVVRFSR